MGTRKHISVNLRDLQRVMNKEEDELPNTNTETKSKFGATKNFEYKLSNNRWENEDYDDDFDLPAEKLIEPDFSTLRDPEPKPVVERKQPVVKVDDSSLDDNWRSQESVIENETSDAWRIAKPKEDQKNHSSNFRNSFIASKNKDQELTREAKNEEPKKLYVPRFRREAAEKPENDRFSCLEDPRDDNSPIRANSLKDSGPFSRNENDRKEDRPRDDWGFIEKIEERPRNDRFREDKYKEEDKSKRSIFSTEVRTIVTDEKKTKEAIKKGLFVPSYRRNLKKEETVEDIFIKAAGLTETNKQTKKFDQELKLKRDVGEADKPKKEVKKNEVVNHNKLFKCSTETVSLVEEYVLSQLTVQDEDSRNTRSGFPEFDEEGSIVPAIVTCVIVLKSCEGCTTLQEVQAMFKNVQKWLLHTTQNHDTRVLLTELAKSTHHWGYPSLSTSVYLIEALFDSLYALGVVNKSDFLQWFESDVDEIPDRVTLLIQLMDWKKWLSGENLEEVVEESESESEDDDSDIEANVPKSIRLTKGVKFK
ncbi:conserved hypothetical protein [Theileria orientalis strain Shintoku]|uniref:W2 domain-containing protein n=1 Tax=Theileria orientalis strain Shintoku TaxID=869250 RepID=J4D8N2_THEOR|nr:conserved hypothetical protein [Theileria orientalis strain Shintoku]BAM40880.1 conserved hypothetical protein [Theileria orientalis strain Shintoku]|eukprot:XP_009691181.1 conserved hypothetical protein [Theileria orientalis strain Shintoku]